MDPNLGYRRLRELIVDLAKVLGLLEENKLSCCGITLSQCQTLAEIGEAGLLSLGDLSARMGLDDSTVSRAVNNLLQKGLCQRETDPRDRRYVAIKLTPAGNEMYGNIERGMNGYYEAIFNALPESKREQVLESIKLLLEAVEKSGCMGGDCCD